MIQGEITPKDDRLAAEVDAVQARRGATGGPALASRVVAVLLFVVLGGFQAGFPPTAWYPVAILLVGALALAGALAGWRVPKLPHSTAAAAAALAAFTAWCFLSIVWADVRGDAWTGANRTLLYFAVFALFALWPCPARFAAALGSLYAVGIAVVMAVFLARAATAANPSEFFIGGRLAEPAGYPNGTCALALGGFWLAFFLGSRRETFWPARPALLAAAVALLEIAVLTQSRGSLVAVPLTAVLYLALVPGRVRSLVWALPVALAVGLASGRLLDVFPARYEGEAFDAAVAAAAAAVAVSAGVAAVVGLCLVLLDRHVDPSPAVVRRVGLGAAALAAAGAVACLVALVVAFGSPTSWARDGWRDFTAVQASGAGGADDSRFSSGLGTNRYDFWRVAIERLGRDPLLGAGADNFAIDYVRERRSEEEPLYPHSLPVGIVSQTGAVGAVLFLGFLVAALVAAWKARQRSSLFGKAVGAGLLVSFAYWFIHGSVDWFWEFPALSAPAFAWLGLAGAVDRAPDGDRTRERRTSATRVIGIGALGLAAAAAVASFLFPWLAARDVDRGVSAWRSNPAEAFRLFDRAHGLNPLSDRADALAGAIASRLGEWDRMRALFQRAIERNPFSWYSYLELGIAESQLGNLAAARRAIERAAELNPREPAVAIALADLDAGRAVPPEVIDRLLLDRVDEITS